MDISKFGIIVEAQTTDCTIEIYLNDIPVGLCGIGSQNKLSLPVHEYLTDGENELTVIVNPGDTPATVRQFSRFEKPAWHAQPPRDPAMDSFMGVTDDDDEDEGDTTAAASDETGNNGQEKAGKAKTTSGPARFFVNVSLYPMGAMAGDGSGTPLISIEWASDRHPVLKDLIKAFPFGKEKDLNPQLYPLQLSKKANLGALFGEPHWRRAKILAPREEIFAEAKEFVMNIKDEIEDGNADAVFAISTEKFREVSAAYGISAEQRAGMFRQLLAEKKGTEDWLFETLEDEELSFRLCAGGRLIECIARDWKPIVRGIENDEGRLLYPMLIGKLEDEWLIMR